MLKTSTAICALAICGMTLSAFAQESNSNDSTIIPTEEIIKNFTYGNASAVEILTSIGLGATGAAGKKATATVDTATTQILRNRGSVGSVMTNAEIDAIVGHVKASPLATFGLGTKSELGGATMSISLDANQLARMSAAANAKAALKEIAADSKTKLSFEAVSDQTGASKVVIGAGPQGAAAIEQEMNLLNSVSPSYATRTINLRTIMDKGGAEGLESYLKMLQEKGVGVRVITFKGVIAQGASKAIGTLTILAFADSAVHGAHAVTDLFQSGPLENNNKWLGDACTSAAACRASKKPGLLTATYDSARVAYFITSKPVSAKKK
jgi:hypothetical protein